jgi:hypothetical protein
VVIKVGDGTVKYSGYNNGGKFTFKGMKNKRRKKMRLKKEAELREKLARQRRQEEREQEWEAAWHSISEDQDRHE